MALNLYRRHGSQCPGGRALHQITYEADELRRGWRKCLCPIYASGTLARHFQRKNTEQTGWDDAKTTASEWAAAGCWSPPAERPNSAPPPPPAPVEPSTPTPMAIADAIQSYLAVREGSGSVGATLRKHRTFTKQLRQFANDRGYVLLEQFVPTDLDAFYAKWKLGPRAKAHGLGLLRGFFRFCVNREWLKKSPVTSDLKLPIGASKAANKVPFTDEELDRILAACDRIEPVLWGNRFLQGVWTGEDVKDFIWLLTYTGLRISDASFFDMKRVRGNEVFLRAKKNGADVFMWIPDWLLDRLRDLEKRRGTKPFLMGASRRLETVTNTWRRKIDRVFELAGEFEENPTPHRFRHTFARILLQRGVPVADVADLLGDDEETVRRHYARWVPERQARLTGILQDAFADKPRPDPQPHLVVTKRPDEWAEHRTWTYAAG